MSAESSAWEHLVTFRWNRGRMDMSDAEARLEDLNALEDALRKLRRATEREVQAERSCSCRCRYRR